jgi:predicted nucleotidyltransferase
MADSTILTMEQLRVLAPELQALTEAYGATRLRVFGSVVQGKARPESDLDLLVDFPSSPSFEQTMDLKLALEDRLRVRVDLVTQAGLRAELRERIEQEAQALI